MANGFIYGVQCDQNTCEVATLIERTMEEIVVPEGVTVLGKCAFRGCSKLKRVILPKGLKTIKDMAFYEITTLEEIELPEGVETIGGSVFSGCKSLAKVTLPESITAIGSTAFNGTAITEFSFPDKVEKIDDRVCYACQKLEKVVAPSACDNIEEFAFANCPLLKVIDFSKCKKVPRLFNANAFGNINAEAKIYVPASLYDEWIAATNWSQLADHINCPYSEGLSYVYDSQRQAYSLVGRGRFWDSIMVVPPTYDDGIHGSLPVAIVGDINDWENDAFKGDDTLEIVILPKSIERLNNYPFNYCTNIRKLHIPGIGGIASFMFEGLASLEYVQFGNITYIDETAFNGSSNVVFDFSKVSAVPELNGGYGNGFGSNPTFKVPSSLLEEWKNDTNWAVYADRIVAAE